MLNTTVSTTQTYASPADALSDGGRAMLKATVPTAVSVERHVADDGHATTYVFLECPQKSFALRGDFYFGPNGASWYADLDLDRDGKAIAGSSVSRRTRSTPSSWPCCALTRPSSGRPTQMRW